MLTDVVLFRRRTLAIALIAFALAFIAWHLPQLGFLLYPLRLFVTFVHEVGHGLAALISGGEIGRLVVMSDGSGIATTAGGSRALILPAGYLGAAFFGAALFYIANTVYFSKTISLVLAIFVAVIAQLYTEFLSTAWLVGMGFALALALLSWKGTRNLNLLVLNLLAVLTALNAVMDLIGLVSNSGGMLGSIRNDAAAFSAEIAPLVPAAVWAILWALAAMLMLGAAVYYSIIRPRRVL
jgi:hypothetical protein